MKTTVIGVLSAIFLVLLADNQMAVGQTSIGGQFVDDFSSTSYSSFFFNGVDSDSNPDDLSFADFLILNTGGNPGGKMEVTHGHGLDENGFDPLVFTQSFFLNDVFVYNPINDGPIGSIDFSIDLDFGGCFDSIFFIVEESGGGGNAVSFLSAPSGGGWQTVNSVNVTQDDVTVVDFDGDNNIQFGFGFTSNEFLNPGEFFDFVGCVDNFTITLNPSNVIGDLNGDGLVNLLDIGPFVNAISSGTFIAEADINGDGLVNLADIGPFVELLSI